LSGDPATASIDWGRTFLNAEIGEWLITKPMYYLIATYALLEGCGRVVAFLDCLEQVSLEYQVEGQPPVTLKVGDVLFIPAGKIHAAKNVGSGNAAELATYIVEKGKPLVVLGQATAARS
jgi:mannose-6-phosphate isomerase-like protein (cupin superfamily)